MTFCHLSIMIRINFIFLYLFILKNGPGYSKRNMMRKRKKYCRCVSMVIILK